MHVVRSVIGKTIKPFLGKFIKAGLEIETDNGFTFNNVDLHEDAIQEMLNRRGLSKIRIDHVSSEQIQVSLGLSNSEVRWRNVKIEACLVNDSSESQTEPNAPSSPDMGSSLLRDSFFDSSYSSSGEPQFSRLENIVSAMHPNHTFENFSIEINLSSQKKVTVTGSGSVCLQEITLTNLRISLNGEEALIVPVSSMSLDLKTLKVETGKCVVESFIDILDTIMSHFASSPDKTDVFFLNIFAGDLTVQTLSLIHI